MRDFYGRPAAVYVIIRDDENILMLKRIGPWKPDEYVPPSGHVEAKETMRAAAVREVMEEVGLIIKEADLVFKYVTHRYPSPEEVDEREYLDFYFEATKYTGQPKNIEPDKHSEMIWVKHEDLDSYPILDYVKKAFKMIEAGEAYGEFGWQ
jgi:8-oxo-dGTP pyrophosphatase MutT (NUDIX family)